MISRLKCKKCGFKFNYEYIPGASFTSIRLGKKRYMCCPKCGKWSLFGLSQKGKDSSLSTYSDKRSFSKYAPITIAPLFAWIVFVVLISGTLEYYGVYAVPIAVVPAIVLAILPMLFIAKARPIKVS